MHGHDRLIFFSLASPCNSFSPYCGGLFISSSMKYKWLKMFIKSFYRFPPLACSTCSSMALNPFFSLSFSTIHGQVQKYRDCDGGKRNLLNAGTRVESYSNIISLSFARGVRLTFMLGTLNNTTLHNKKGLRVGLVEKKELSLRRGRRLAVFRWLIRQPNGGDF